MTSGPGSTVDIKSGNFHMPVIQIQQDSIEDIQAQVISRLSASPTLFRHAPVVIDVSALGDERIQLEPIIQSIREQGAIPFALRTTSEVYQAEAVAMGMAFLAESGKLGDHPPQAPRQAPPPGGQPSAFVTARIVDQPVRSGQRIYAQESDLVVLAPVSPGAEIMADGNIHIYNTLRGRALAGVKGNEESRIFCLDLQAELVSISGHYKTSEQLENTSGKPIQISLNDQSLLITPL